MDKEQDWLEDPVFTKDELNGIADVIESTLDSMDGGASDEEVTFWTNILRKCDREDSAVEWEESFFEDRD